ncbi:MAG: glutamine synthetase III [Clostridia bacterium]|nr:glutamine synthetase III [Clostridia bacterium]
MNKNITEFFGSRVFNDDVMRERLSGDDYAALKKAIDEGAPLTMEVADRIASAMKDWAIEKGATHYTHWFQPMTGITAEKHDSFLKPDKEGRPIMAFSGKNLIKGESDASSFPSGGLRATFEARGYTAWDPTSYAFVKDGSLYIPTVFCSYSGDTLDQKTPLLRSMQALSREAVRLLRICGNNDINRVSSMVGSEQEYFLIDKSTYDRRPDIMYSGRTLFGAPAPKGQEGDYHYYGAIKPRIAKFMAELDEELWKLGIFSQTKHNEFAPAQHELAPFFEEANSAVDHNHLTMEYMRKVAERHGLVCLLHEKPFERVNGSGKHNNWSLMTDTGVNLLDAGSTPEQNAQFLLFFAAVIKAVDEYQDLLRMSVATASNDCRLGGNEAPPTILSVYVGDELEKIIEKLVAKENPEHSEAEEMKLGVSVLPTFPKDMSDRNRTSPFAFTGNKFEFRAVGSSLNIAAPNTVLNTIVAEELRKFSDKLEARTDDFGTALNRLIRHTLRDHKRIIFNGNGYSKEWVEEAERRGLVNYPTTADAIPHLTDRKNIELFERHGIYSELEIRSRRDISLISYSGIIKTEALAMIEMVNRGYLPAISRYKTELRRAETIGGGVMEHDLSKRLQKLCDNAYREVGALEDKVDAAEAISDATEKSRFFCDKVIPNMKALRSYIDEAEKIVASDVWPYPTYGELMFNI